MGMIIQSVVPRALPETCGRHSEGRLTVTGATRWERNGVLALCWCGGLVTTSEVIYGCL